MKDSDEALPPPAATAESDPGALAEARELGARDAAHFDLTLRHHEACHLIRELTRARRGGTDCTSTRPRTTLDRSATGRHRELLRHHLRFCRALADSRPWQLLRRATGPRWTPPVETLLDDLEAAALRDEALDETLSTVSAFVGKVLESPEWRLLQRARTAFGRRW